MAKRKLSQQQKRRIQAQHKDRRRKAQQQTAVADENLGPEQEGLVVSNYGAFLDIEDGVGNIHRCIPRQNLEPLVCGDRVVWQEGLQGSGVVSALIPRRGLLVRPDDRGKQRPVAANIDQILIVIAPQPGINEELLDRYLVAAEYTGIEPVIVLNKTDLMDARAEDSIGRKLQVYRDIGYAVVHSSIKSDAGLENLNAVLEGKTSVFVGESGVGKSSLVNCLLPEAEARIGGLSETTGQGVHTTTASRLYHLPKGGDIIDSPGIREFSLGHLDRAALADGFREFHRHADQCRFRNCTHTVEPGCAVVEAVENGDITPRRLQSYQQILAEQGD